MRILLFVLCTALVPGLSADIYRSVDEDGNVTFSDTPSEGAEKVEKKEAQTIDSTPAGRGDSDSSKQRNPGPRFSYRRVAITSPQDDESVRQNNGNITVQITVEPPLRRGDSLHLFMDGERVASGRATSVDLENVDRGTHTLQARIVATDGTVRESSRSVGFHLLRHSRLNSPPPAGPLNPPGGPVSGPDGNQGGSE